MAHEMNNPRRLRRVMAVRFSALGDVAMTVPVLYSVCACYPGVEFIFVTRKAMTSIFINAPANLTVVGVDLEGYKGLGGLRRLFRQLRREHDFDAFVDLHDVLRTRVLRTLARLHGITTGVINKGRKGKRALTRRNNKILLPLLSSRARYRQVFHSIGLPVESSFEGLYGTGGTLAPAEAFACVTPDKAPGEKWIGIAPFAQHPGKIYPPELMEEVVRELIVDESHHVFLFGGGGYEKETLDEWARKYPRVISLAGKRYGFGVELPLMSRLDVMISMDSANMHLASLVAVPVVSVWGATHPYCGFKGWRQSEADIVQLPITCRPCSVFGNRPCFQGAFQCMRGIPPHLIAARASAHLK